LEDNFSSWREREGMSSNALHWAGIPLRSIPASEFGH